MKPTKTSKAYRLIVQASAFSIALGALSTIAIHTNASASVVTTLTAGDLIVEQADSASSNNTTFTMVEVNPALTNQTTGVESISINGTSGSNALRTSGSASTTGYLSRSNDGTLLDFTGGNTSSSSNNINTYTLRGVGTLSGSGSYTLQTTYTGSSGNQTRSATSLNNTNWFIGDQGGQYTNGATSASNTSNLRDEKSFGGTVYALSQTFTNSTVDSLSGSPSSPTFSGLSGVPTASDGNDFYLVSSGSNGSTYDELYILHQGSGTSGSIAKFSLVSGSWVANGTFSETFGGFAMAAHKSATSSNVSLYVTTGTGGTAGNSLIGLVDTSGYNHTINVGSSQTTLYTTGSSTTIKGVELAADDSDFVPTATSATLREMSGNAATTSVNVNNTGNTKSSYTTAASSGITSSPSTSSVFGNGAAGSVTIGFGDNATVGSRSGSVTVTGTSLVDPVATISVSGAVVNNRVVTASTASLGSVFVNTTTPIQTSSLTTTGADSAATRVKVGTGVSSGGVTVSGGTNPLFNAATVTDTRSVTGDFSSAGSKSGNVTLITTVEGLLGESAINVSVPYTATVYDHAAIGASAGSMRLTQGQTAQSVITLTDPAGGSALRDTGTVTGLATPASGFGSNYSTNVDVAQNATVTSLTATYTSTPTAAGSATYTVTYGDKDAFTGQQTGNTTTFSITPTVDNLAENVATSANIAPSRGNQGSVTVSRVNPNSYEFGYLDGINAAEGVVTIDLIGGTPGFSPETSVALFDFGANPNLGNLSTPGSLVYDLNAFGYTFHTYNNANGTGTGVLPFITHKAYDLEIDFMPGASTATSYLDFDFSKYGLNAQNVAIVPEPIGLVSASFALGAMLLARRPRRRAR